jgi:hypothetical protein
METSKTTTDAARSWMDYIRAASAQAGLDTHKQGKQPEPGAPSPVLNLSPTMTPAQRAERDALQALEQAKADTLSPTRELTPTQAEALRLIREHQSKP